MPTRSDLLNTSILFLALTSVSCNFFEKPIVTYTADSTIYIDSKIIEPQLNPIYNFQANSEEKYSLIFQKLLSFDSISKNIIPCLSEGKPQITKTPEGGLLLTYKIKDAAKWDDGNDITTKDVAFSFKALKCAELFKKQIDQKLIRIKDIKFYDDDPKKITFITTVVYDSAEFNTGAEIFIIPKHIYDSAGYLDRITFDQLADSSLDLSSNLELKKFFSSFNSPIGKNFTGNPNGSGPYKIVEWIMKDKIVFQFKNKWWASKEKEITQFVNPKLKNIIYTIPPKNGEVLKKE